MAKDYAKAFYDSDAWHACRDAYKQSVGGLCERCRKRGLIKAGEIVHHKVYLTPRNINDPRVALNFANLELVCLDCHNVEHTAHKKRYVFDVRGNLIPPVADRVVKN